VKGLIIGFVRVSITSIYVLGVKTHQNEVNEEIISVPITPDINKLTSNKLYNSK